MTRRVSVSVIGLICGVIATGWIPASEDRVFWQMGGVASGLSAVALLLLASQFLFGPLAEKVFARAPVWRGLFLVYAPAGLLACLAITGASYALTTKWIGAAHVWAPELWPIGVLLGLSAISLGAAAVRDRRTALMALDAIALGLLSSSSELAAWLGRL